MANSYDNNPISIDTVAANLDIANLAFGLSTTPVYISKVVFTDPTAADVFVLKNKAGDTVVDMLVLTTNDDVTQDFDTPIHSQGLQLLAADNTMTTGKALIYLA